MPRITYKFFSVINLLEFLTYFICVMCPIIFATLFFSPPIHFPLLPSLRVFIVFILSLLSVDLILLELWPLILNSARSSSSLKITLFYRLQKSSEKCILILPPSPILLFCICLMHFLSICKWFVPSKCCGSSYIFPI